MPKRPRDNNPTSSYLEGKYDDESLDAGEKFGKRSKFHQINKTAQTAERRQNENATDGQTADLTPGRVIQVFSLFAEVENEAGQTILCTARRTLRKVRETDIVVGDRVRYRPAVATEFSGAEKAEGVIEHVEPRKTVLTRADSFKALTQHPIVANATHMLIVAALLNPKPKWGLIDRMLVAALAGGLVPVVCLNKIDLAKTEPGGPEALAEAQEVLSHYRSMGIDAVACSAEDGSAQELLLPRLSGSVTVLAGHSGVGKSSLVRRINPSLDIRVGELSSMHNKGKHTTTSARIYKLTGEGLSEYTEVIDTPGVKLFGLWNVSQDNLDEYFPDVPDGTAPQWRVESYKRISESLGKKLT